MPDPVDPSRTAAAQHQHSSAASDRDETASASPPRGTTAPRFAPPAAPGEVGVLGPYRVLKQLGAGGMGAVYAALDTRLGRKLALKVMLPEFAADRAAKERFLREARAAALITHDNVVTVYEADERQGVPYIAMQFLEGYPLDEYLKRKGNPTVPQLLRIARETAAGLAAAHKLGLIHRDIKPANLWLEAPNGRVKVLDFGLAKPVDAEYELTKSGAVVGTPAYMSPEQGRGLKVDHRSDLFSLGSVLYRLCTGKLPFRGPTTMAVLMALGSDEPTPVRELNPDVPESLAALIHQLLAKNPDARPPSAAEVIRRVDAIEDELAAPQALPVEAPSGSQPQVVYVPIQVTAVLEANPFADLDATEAEPAPAEASEPTEPKPVRPKPRGNALWLAAGVVALAALIVGVVIIVIKNKDGTETKIEVSDGSTVTIGKDGKTVVVTPPGVDPKATTDPDRKAAEYVISIGGNVMVNGEDRIINIKAAELPKGRFTLRQAYMPNTPVTDAGLANFKDCKNLTSLDVNNEQVTDAGLAYFKDCKSLTHLRIGGTAVTDTGLAHFKDCKGLVYLFLSGTKVTDAGLVHFKDCKNLTNLFLASTAVTDVGLENFKDRKGLIFLDLSSTQVTDAGLANFKDCKGLEYLNLNATKVRQ